MDWPTHGLQGGIIYAFPVKYLLILFGIEFNLAIMIAFALGFYHGAWPDAGDWIHAKLGLHERWVMYRKYHVDYDQTYWKYAPAFIFHVKYVDPAFHKKPDWISQEEWDSGKPGVRNWWKWMKMDCMFFWLLTILLVVDLFKDMLP